ADVLQLQGGATLVSRVLYLDCFSGISGDMTIGALLDAGLPLADLQRALGSLALGDAHVSATKVQRAGVSATKFSVHEHPNEHPHEGAGHRHARHSRESAEHSHEGAGHRHEGAGHSHEGAEHSHDGAGHRTLAEVSALIDASSLSPSGKARAKGMFQ